MDRPKVKSVPADEALEAATDDDDREPTKEEIMDNIRQGLRDVFAGEEGMPARESIAALRQRIYGDANDS
ncbi:MAG: hypothetical protein OXG49_14735 [Chloroflexi bacterium]|nr:hypothetical protein [Chloroflexota bacterium]